MQNRARSAFADRDLGSPGRRRDEPSSLDTRGSDRFRCRRCRRTSITDSRSRSRRTGTIGVKVLGVQGDPYTDEQEENQSRAAGARPRARGRR